MPKTTTGNLNPHPRTVKETLGQSIRLHRKGNKLSQMDLASRAKLELSTIHRIETGKTDSTISTLSRIRNVLKVPWNKMLHRI